MMLRISSSRSGKSRDFSFRLGLGKNELQTDSDEERREAMIRNVDVFSRHGSDLALREAVKSDVCT